MLKLKSTRTFLIALVVIAAHAGADQLSIATWNVEHLNESNNAGCIPRVDDDYDYIAQRIADLDADVVAIQEVESAFAAKRVFPTSVWDVHMSDRPNERGDDGGSICWGTEDKRLRHQATGFAVKKGLSVQTNDSFEALAPQGSEQRWGADITVTHDDTAIRLLSVHLASGCWGPPQDSSSQDRTRRICETLRYQIDRLVEWVAERNAANEAFVILGDFNRRLALENDWAAAKLVSDQLQTTLITGEIRKKKNEDEWCDARYANLIDHIIVSNSIADKVDPESVIEHERGRESPDHCIISANLVL